ncbi:hypothetical protein Dimus_005854 [Dionaea muscipula]
MFYSHQLLARKAPLGQIWMAATMHAKMNRRKLDQINIIKICEEILNPSVPMALRLSGILMGGVVIVYERKVKLLYDDVSRLLVELNKLWKVKPAVDPILLPKGKSHAKFTAVTLPDNQDTDLGEIDGLVDVSNNHTTIEFQQTAYFAMRLDKLDSLNENFIEADLTQHHHQADTANITLFDTFDVHQTETGRYDRFERFDTELDEETQFNFPPEEQPEIPTTLIPSPPSMEAPKDDEFLDKDVDRQGMFVDLKQKDAAKQMQSRRIGRQRPAFMMDDEQTIIPGDIYQTWLRSSSDIISRRGKDKKLHHVSAISKMKLAQLMDLPPVVLSSGLIANCTGEIHYPTPLMELWMRSRQPPEDSPSGKTSPPLAPEAASRSPALEGLHHPNPSESGLGGFQTFAGLSFLASREKQREPKDPTYVPEIDLMLHGFGRNGSNQNATPSLSVDARSMSTPSLGSGPGHISTNSDGNSLKSSKKRPYSSSGNSGGFLEPLDEEHQWGGDFTLSEEVLEPNFKLAKWDHNGLTHDQELLVETGPTQTQYHPLVDENTANRTNIIRTHLKSYFETPGAPQAESLNQLAYGMNKQRAAQLFYQICILATRDCLKVEQFVAYGDVLISRGPRM